MEAVVVVVVECGNCSAAVTQTTTSTTTTANNSCSVCVCVYYCSRECQVEHYALGKSCLCPCYDQVARWI